MQPSDVLRRLRYALDLRDAEVADMMNQLGGEPVTLEHVVDLLRPERSEGWVAATDPELQRALEGLILARRGPPASGVAPVLSDVPLDANAVLKKLRIALTFHEEDMLATLAKGGLQVSPQELGAWFRKPGHKHYRACPDAALDAFLKGLAQWYRQSAPSRDVSP